MFRLLKSLYQDTQIFFDKYYFLTIFIIARNQISRQYRDSFLGILWTLLQPTSQVLIYSLVLPKIMRFPVESYVPFLIGALLPWALISGVLIGCTNSLIVQGETIKRCLVSKTIFPLADVCRYLYNYIISFLAMYLFAIAFLTKFNPIVFLLPIYLIPILIILGSLAIALAYLAPYMRDLCDIMTVGMNVSFWLTPVVYPISAIPEQYHIWFEFNPFYIMIRPLVAIVHAGTVPTTHMTLTLLALMVVVAFGCYSIYKICRRNFVYYL
jgi:ABC-type polysaccharide/polyol phosphate export permease